MNFNISSRSLFYSSNHDEVYFQDQWYLSFAKVRICLLLLFILYGSFTFSNRFPGIGWSYFGADPEWGEIQSKQLQVRSENLN